MVKKKRLFVENGQPHGTVVLNWHGTPEREFTYFAEAFRVLAQESVATLRQNSHFGLHGVPIEDFRAYPVVFLYRHALELYMKAVLLVGSPMLSLKGETEINREQLLKTHSLDLLRKDLEAAKGKVFTMTRKHTLLSILLIALMCSAAAPLVKSLRLWQAAEQR